MSGKVQAIDLDNHLFLFHEGSDCRAYEFMGAHFDSRDNADGVVFRVWAPDAKGVSVIGEFNGWRHGESPMSKISVGVWELFIPNISEYEGYKYAVEGRNGVVQEKSDPYAFHAEVRPKTASKVYDLGGYEWGDGDWIAARSSPYDRPMNIYELHLGSWRRGEGGRLLTYAEIAGLLIPYVKEMGYTHIELMPVTEHPLDASWGYQVTGYFAATSRYGTPKDLMRLIDLCHQSGVGVILDWVPAHFPKDGHGLIEFDGGCCYEYSDESRREHPDWGTRVFDYGRNETRAFLMSSAIFWLDVYHADGLRVDAVASMLYLDYGKRGGGPRNIYGGRENLEALSFLRKTNEQVFAAFPHALMIAEESTAWPMVTKPAYMGGLGFNFKWNMGWMNDTLSYVKLDPIFRQYNHNKMTFPMMYAFSENFILPLSHDEVVHGKCSLVAKMPGYYVDKFAGLRVYLAFMAAHPGKKLTFMGSDIAQFIEWNSEQSLDWHLLDLDNDMHKKHQEFVKTLNLLYLNTPAFWEIEDGWDGFTWITPGDYQGNTLAFLRSAKTGPQVVCLFNFSPVNREGYRLPLPGPGIYHEVLNTNDNRFGGFGQVNGSVAAENVPCGQMQWSAQLTLPPYGAVIFVNS
ncbi:MAG: 1,4-alpha-glucan branching protein GlgB [Oscillospiraceae bacterium]|jgi:1,4-alpha-glucan branching enzyme|nr:1,4-alpha-glucan branching protein GlgB [Oscillospiraceae bacterium]